MQFRYEVGKCLEYYKIKNVKLDKQTTKPPATLAIADFFHAHPEHDKQQAIHSAIVNVLNDKGLEKVLVDNKNEDIIKPHQISPSSLALYYIRRFLAVSGTALPRKEDVGRFIVVIVVGNDFTPPESSMVLCRYFLLMI
jgi:hypothetical protein